MEPLQLLEAKLLPLGGERVVWLGFDEDLDKILERGRVFAGEGATVEQGAPSQCHSNVARLWDEDSNAICTGYALSDDGLWRQHSWLLASDGTIVETTEPRTLYFGFVLEGDEASDFFYNNW